MRNTAKAERDYMYTNFSSVCHMNRVFGTTQCGNRDIDWEGLKKQSMMLRSEVDELDEAIRTRNYEQVKDACGDIAVFNYGFGFKLNFDFDKLMDNIYESNVSKVHIDGKQAQATLEAYEKKGVACVIRTVDVDGATFYVVKSAKQQKITKGTRELEPKGLFGRLHFLITGKKPVETICEIIPEGKTLKNVNWKEPDLDVDFPESALIDLSIPADIMASVRG